MAEAIPSPMARASTSLVTLSTDLSSSQQLSLSSSLSDLTGDSGFSHGAPPREPKHVGFVVEADGEEEDSSPRKGRVIDRQTTAGWSQMEKDSETDRPVWALTWR